MAIFRVTGERKLKSKQLSSTSSWRLTATPLEGEIKAGMSFTAFETHHPFNVVIHSVQKLDEQVLLECEADWNIYEGFFEKAVIDTSGAKRGVHFFYDYDNKYRGNAP